MWFEFMVWGLGYRSIVRRVIGPNHNPNVVVTSQNCDAQTKNMRSQLGL